MRPADADPKKPGLQRDVTLQGQAATAKGVPPHVTVRGTIYQYDPSNPKANAANAGWIPVAGPGPGPAKPAKPIVIHANGTIYTMDPKTNRVTLAPGAPPPTVKGAKPPTLIKARGTVYIEDPNGRVHLAPGAPPPTRAGGSAKAPFTAKQRKDAWTAINASRSAWQTSGGQPLNPANIARIVANFNARMTKLGKQRQTGTDASGNPIYVPGRRSRSPSPSCRR